jgi:taurine dioxygenase
MSLTLERPFTVEPLSPVLGASIVGLDLREPLPEATKRAVYDAFIRYHVLCFRDQHLDHDQQIAFSEQFGTLERHMAMNRGTVHPLVHIVTNLGADGKPTGKVASTLWHSDKSFRPQPSLATILHALVMPPDGGETCFANMIAATRRCRSREGRSSTASVSCIAGRFPGHARGPKPRRRKSRTPRP